MDARKPTLRRKQNPRKHGAHQKSGFRCQTLIGIALARAKKKSVQCVAAQFRLPKVAEAGLSKISALREIGETLVATLAR